MRTEARLTQPQAKECRQPPEAGRGKEQTTSEPREETQSYRHLDFRSAIPIPEFCPPGKGKRMRELTAILSHPGDGNKQPEIWGMTCQDQAYEL